MTDQQTNPVVLVVDDEDAIRQVARRVLEGGGYRVIEARDGEEALRFVDQGVSIDLLMADLQMPVMQGDEIARQFRRARPDVKVLYVSAFVDLLFQGRTALWQGEAFLDKPFTRAGLLEAVSLLLWGSLHGLVPRPAVASAPRNAQALVWQ